MTTGQPPVPDGQFNWSSIYILLIKNICLSQMSQQWHSILNGFGQLWKFKVIGANEHKTEIAWETLRGSCSNFSAEKAGAKFQLKSQTVVVLVLPVFNLWTGVFKPASSQAPLQTEETAKTRQSAHEHLREMSAISQATDDWHLRLSMCRARARNGVTHYTLSTCQPVFARWRYY